MEEWYVAISVCYWGRGHTLDEAKERLFKQGATRIEPRIVKKLPPGAKDPWVDDTGSVRWGIRPLWRRTGL